MDVEQFEANIGKKCKKRPLDDKNIGKYKLKPFKSGLKVNTISGVIPHPKLEGRMAYTFDEDESYVECRRCEVIKLKIKIKSKEEIRELTPVKPEGFWWKSMTSNFIYLSLILSPFLSISLVLVALGNVSLGVSFFVITFVTIISLSIMIMDNLGPVFSDKYFNIHYYKKRNSVWNKWWMETNKHIKYLEYKQKYDI